MLTFVHFLFTIIKGRAIAMKEQSNPLYFSSPGRRIATAIRACLLEKGWEMGELARRADISRTTLYHLLQGTTRHPHFSTVSKIAVAFGLSPEALCPDSFVGTTGKKGEETSGDLPLDLEKQQQFNRTTNTYITDVCKDSPQIFSGWSQADWDELFSTVGVGGALSPEGVIQAATEQNKKREVLQKLSIVLETHLSDVAFNFVETLYQMVQASENLEQSAQLQQLLSGNLSSPVINPISISTEK